VGGYSLVSKPSAFIRQIVKNRVANLTLFSNISSYDTDLLVGAHLVKKAYLAHVTFEYLGLAPNYRRAAETGEIEIIDCDASLLLAGYLATIEGLSFHPVSAVKGTDVLKRMDLVRHFTSPDGEDMLAVSAIAPDVAVIHVAQADQYGNARHLGNPLFDVNIFRAARKVIVTTEKLVSVRVTESEPWRTTVPCYYVDAVVEVPFGTHPCACPPLYVHDEEHLTEYLEASRRAIAGESAEAFSAYMEKYVYQPDSIYAYLELVGGVERMARLMKEAQT
jgi:glutaconate CoA-transferase subunit A